MLTEIAGAPGIRRSRGPLLPLALAAAVFVADQALKFIIVATVPEGSVGWKAGGDFFWLVHARNLGIAFSLGYGFPESVRRILFVFVPLLMLLGILVFLFRSRELSAVQRWTLCGIVGGGAGNLADRMFRPAGVVDFVSLRFYGLFGLERWPTFNLADASVLVCAIALLISGFIPEKQRMNHE
jgi:signal peptidase II